MQVVREMGRYFHECRWAPWLCITILVDLVASVVLLTHGVIQEGNPLFAWLWQQSPLLFCGAKVVLSLLALMALAVAYNHRPGLVDQVTWWLTVIHVAVWMASIMVAVSLRCTVGR